MLESLPIPLWTLPTFCVSSVLMTYATYKRYQEYSKSGDTMDQIVAHVSAVAAAAMWVSTILLAVGCVAGGAWLAWAPLFLVVGVLCCSVSSGIEGDRKVALAKGDGMSENYQMSMRQANVRWWVEMAGILLSCVVGSVASPVTACYLAFASCQIVWNFVLPEKLKNDIKSCFGLGKTRLFSTREVRERDDESVRASLSGVPQDFGGAGKRLGSV